MRSKASAACSTRPKLSRYNNNGVTVFTQIRQQSSWTLDAFCEILQQQQHPFLGTFLMDSDFDDSPKMNFRASWGNCWWWWCSCGKSASAPMHITLVILLQRDFWNYEWVVSFSSRLAALWRIAINHWHLTAFQRSYFFPSNLQPWWQLKAGKSSNVTVCRMNQRKKTELFNQSKGFLHCSSPRRIFCWQFFLNFTLPWNWILSNNELALGLINKKRQRSMQFRFQKHTR